MARTWANIRDEIEQQLQDTANSTWAVAEIDYYIARGLTRISEVVPYEKVETFKIESRTGKATSTSANNLVDATEAQFLSTDVGKVVFNTDDNTFAIITSQSSTSQVGLSKDIFTSGENYDLYNDGCRSNREMNIKDIRNWLWIMSAEYPTMRELPRYRNWERNGDILRLHLGYEPDDSKDVDSDVEVYVKFAKRHYVSELTDFAGAVNQANGYAAGATIMDIDGLSGTEIIRAGNEFEITTTLSQYEETYTIGLERGVYTVKKDVTLAAGAGANVEFFPALESAVANNDVITMKETTLSTRLEDILIDWVTAYALLQQAAATINKVNVWGNDAWRQYTDRGERMMGLVMRDLNAMLDPSKRMHLSYSSL